MQFKCNSCNRTFQLTKDEYNYFNDFMECPHCSKFVKIKNFETGKTVPVKPVNPVKVNKPVKEKEIVEISWKVYHYIYLHKSSLSISQRMISLASSPLS